MIKTVSVAVAGLFLLAAGCKSSGDKAFTGETPSGYPYIMHIDKEGTTPQVGDELKYVRRVRLGKDSILAEQEMIVKLPSADLVSEQAMAEYEILFLLSEGDSASVYIMGDKLNAIPGFQPTDTIIFDFGFKGILRTAEQVMEEHSALKAREEAISVELDQRIKAYKSGALKDQLRKTESGLQYIIHQEGEGATPAAGNIIKVHYYGMLMDGTMFDNSFRRFEAFEFNVGMGMVIPGWDEGLLLVKKGGSATFFIPADQAYGAMGSPPTIPENADLVFYVEVLDVREN
jgi:FKBP-type peptidyl-prolyl cis-trans isomerase FkpA